MRWDHDTGNRHGGFLFQAANASHALSKDAQPTLQRKILGHLPLGMVVAVIEERKMPRIFPKKTDHLWAKSPGVQWNRGKGHMRASRLYLGQEFLEVQKTVR